MKNIDPKYHEALRQRQVVESCLREAQERNPGAELSFCGLEDNWEDCIGSSMLNETGDGLSLLFYFNIGAATKAIMVSVPLE